MSVDCYFFIEVKDAEGKWHLVKWYADEAFDKFSEDDARYSYESETTIDSVKYVVKREAWTGLQWRDELSWGRHWGGINNYEGLPNDVSEELDKLLRERAERDIEERRKLYNKEDYTFDYKKQFGYIYLDDMWSVCNDKMEEWKKRFFERVRDIQLDEIKDKLNDIEKLIMGKEVKKSRKKKEEYDEDTLEYLVEEEMEDIICLRQETKMIATMAENFTGDRWLDSDRVRVIYYFS